MFNDCPSANTPASGFKACRRSTPIQFFLEVKSSCLGQGIGVSQSSGSGAEATPTHRVWECKTRSLTKSIKETKQHTNTLSWICKYYFIVLSQFCPFIQLSHHKSPHRSPLHRNRAGLRAMDAFVIKFMTASFYYFLRLAYKAQEGKSNGRKECRSLKSE